MCGGDELAQSNSEVDPRSNGPSNQVLENPGSEVRYGLEGVGSGRVRIVCVEGRVCGSQVSQMGLAAAAATTKLGLQD